MPAFAKQWRHSPLSLGEFARIYFDVAQLESKFRRLGRHSEFGPLFDQLLAESTALTRVQYGPRRPDVERRHTKALLKVITTLFTVAWELDRDGPPQKVDKQQLRADRPLATSLAYTIQECTEQSWEEFLAHYPHARVLGAHGPRIFSRRNVNRKRLTIDILAAIFNVSVQTIRNTIAPVAK